MRLNWHKIPYEGGFMLYVDDMLAAVVHQPRLDVYGVRMYNGSTWVPVGEFPTREEAQQCAELLAPIYAGFTE